MPVLQRHIPTWRGTEQARQEDAPAGLISAHKKKVGNNRIKKLGYFFLPAALMILFLSPSYPATVPTTPATMIKTSNSVASSAIVPNVVATTTTPTTTVTKAVDTAFLQLNDASVVPNHPNNNCKLPPNAVKINAARTGSNPKICITGMDF